MTESEWLACEDARTMREWLRGQFNAHRKKVGRRKLQLFGCACVRDHWHLLTDPRTRRAIECVEAVADGADEAELEAVRADARNAYMTVIVGWPGMPKTPEEKAERRAQRQANEDSHALIGSRVPDGDRADPAMRSYGRAWEFRDRLRVLAGYLRDIFGNPFRPVKFPKKWRTEHTTGLALKMYDEREFAAMPILADALEEAGCDNQDLLTHCREPGVHVRGCWVVDLVLGKA